MRPNRAQSILVSALLAAGTIVALVGPPLPAAVAAAGPPPPTAGAVNIALGASTAESSPGWGGGAQPAEMVDGKIAYSDTWAHGLAFTGGPKGWAGQPCGSRQAVVDFGVPKRFDAARVWHHGPYADHVPSTYDLQYFDGSSWKSVGGTSAVRPDLDSDLFFPGSWAARPTQHVFPAVTGSKVRFIFDNCQLTTGDGHGWIYEFEVFGRDAADFAINLTTFIPGNNVRYAVPCLTSTTLPGPPGRPSVAVPSGVKPLYVRTDDRLESGQVVYDPSSSKYRTRQTATVSSAGLADEQNLNTLTDLYASDALPVLDDGDNDGVPNDCRLYHASQPPAVHAMDVRLVSATEDLIVVQLLGRVGTGTSVPVPGTFFPCPIDWDLTVRIDTSTSPARYEVSGRRDLFPAFELYINGQPVNGFAFSPGRPPYGLVDLAKLCIPARSVQASGQLAS